MEPKGNKAVAAKLRAIGKIMKDADQRGMIPDYLHEQLVLAGLTDLERSPGWVSIVGEEADLATPMAELVFDDCKAGEPCNPSDTEDPAIAETPDSTREGQGRELSVGRTQTEDSGQSSEAEEDIGVTTNGREVVGGWGLLWCMDGKEMYVVEYEGDSAPWKDQVANEGDVIMAMRCEVCRGATRRSVFEDAHYDDDQDEQAFRRMRPWMFEKIPAREVAEVVRGKAVAIAQRGNGVAFVDAEKIVKRLGRGDRIRSVDMAKFERGEREGLLEGWLRGGLI
jgi:hypothetical protein